MKPRQAIAEDLRRFGIILLAAGVVGGFFKGHVSLIVSVLAVLFGVLLPIVGYWLYRTEENK